MRFPTALGGVTACAKRNRALMTNSAWRTEQRHTILELWKEAVATSPDTVFLHFLDDNEKYTYAEFDALSNRLAQGPVSYTHLTLPTTPYV